MNGALPAVAVFERESPAIPSRIGDFTPAKESRREEHVRCVLLALTLCGAVLDRRSIEFARGIAEVLIWSAERARNAAERRHDATQDDWQCTACGEQVPANFDLCWNCEALRSIRPLPPCAAGEGDCQASRESNN